MKKDRYQELSEIWLKKAQDDFSWARDSFKSRHFDGACFICQQIAEKSLKAFLFSKKQKLIRTHNLERLLEKSIVFNKEFLKLKRNCQVLNRYYIDTRYPDIWDYSRFDEKDLAREAMSLAKEILQFTSNKIKNQ